MTIPRTDLRSLYCSAPRKEDGREVADYGVNRPVRTEIGFAHPRPVHMPNDILQDNLRFMDAKDAVARLHADQRRGDATIRETWVIDALARGLWRTPNKINSKE